jgi:hypothetical protein
MKIYCLEIRDPKLPKSITGLTFFITFFTILIEEKKGGPLGIKRERERDEKLKNYGSLIGAN